MNVAATWSNNLPDGALPIFTIYDRPLDYPEQFVVRRWFVLCGKLSCDVVPRLADTLEQARQLVPPGLVCCDRQPGEDPAILESWV